MDDRKAHVADAAHKEDYMGGPWDEESNSGVFLPAGKENNDGKNLYKKQESAGPKLSVNHILDKVTSTQSLNILYRRRSPVMLEAWQASEVEPCPSPVQPS